jgi:hypothetical protein
MLNEARVVNCGRKAERFQLSEEDRIALGPLAPCMQSDDAVEVLNALYETVKVEWHKDTDDPLYRTRTITALWRAYAVMVEAGAWEAEQLFFDLERGLQRLERAGRKVLLRNIFDAGTSDEEASGIIEFLCEKLINKGEWKDWKRDFSRAMTERR